MGIKRLFYYFVANTGTVVVSLLSFQYLTTRLFSIVNNQSYIMDITGLNYYLTGTLNTSSTAANGAYLVNFIPFATALANNSSRPFSLNVVLPF